MSFPVLVLLTYLLHRKHGLCHHYILKYVVLMLLLLYVVYTGLSEMGEGGHHSTPLPQILAGQFSYSNQRGKITA